MYWVLVLLALTQMPCVAGVERYGDVTEEELAQTAHPSYPEAKAAYLVKNTTVWYDLQSTGSTLRTIIYHKIKIYNQEGIDEFGDFVEYIYNDNGNREKLVGLKAQSHTLVDGKIEKQKLSKKDVYRGEESDSYDFVKFAFPGVQIGSVIEVRYELISPFLYSTPRHYFQQDVPVEFSRFELDSPQYISLSPVATGFVPLQRAEESGATRGAIRTAFSATDVPPILDDEYVLDIDDYRSSLKFEVHSTNWPGEATKMFSESWESIGNRLAKSSTFGKTLDDKIGQTKGFVTATKLLSPEERVAAVYQYVKDNVTWNRSYGLYASKSLSKVLKAGTGNVADMNLLLINLLRKVDIQAYPVATKPRSYGLLNQHYPSLTELRYVVALATVGDNQMMLDASSRYSAMGSLPIRALNIEGLLVADSGHRLISIINNNVIKIKNIAKLQLDPEALALQGTGSIKLSGYAATKARIKADKEEDDEDNQDLEGGDDENDDKDEDEDEEDSDDEDDIDLEEDDYTTISSTGLEDTEADIKSEYECTLPAPVTAIGDEIFIDAFIIQEFADNPFKAEDREFPAFFNSMHDHMYVAVLEKPDGMVVESMPENLTMTMEGGKGSFIYAVTEDDAKLSVRCVLKIKETIFGPEDYDVLRRFFDAVLDKQEEKIVLKRT